MIKLPNATPEALGTGGTVKFRSPCPVIVEKVGVGNVATLTGTDTFTATEPGEFLFENTCDCAGFYEVTNVGDMTDGCCVKVEKDDDGYLKSLTVGSETIDVKPVDPPVTYTFTETNPVDGDGDQVFTVTPSNGDPAFDMVIPEPDGDENTILTGSSVDENGIVTYTFQDAEGNPLPSQTLDLSSLINTDPVTIEDCEGNEHSLADIDFNQYGNTRRNLISSSVFQSAYNQGSLGQYSDTAPLDQEIVIPAFDATSLPGYDACDTHVQTEIRLNLQLSRAVGAVGASVIETAVINGTGLFHSVVTSAWNNGDTLSTRDYSYSTETNWLPIDAAGMVGPFTVKLSSSHTGGANQITNHLFGIRIEAKETAMGNR